MHMRKGWFSNTSFTIGLKTLPTFRPDALVFFALKKTRASGRNVSKVFNPVVKLVLENQPFLMPEPTEKPSLQCIQEMMAISIEHCVILTAHFLQKNSISVRILVICASEETKRDTHVQINFCPSLRSFNLSYICKQQRFACQEFILLKIVGM